MTNAPVEEGSHDLDALLLLAHGMRQAGNHLSTTVIPINMMGTAATHSEIFALVTTCFTEWLSINSPVTQTTYDVLKTFIF